ncbi:MAG: alpha/beta hydrolase family protein [Acidobacteriota bacterium]
MRIAAMLVVASACVGAEVPAQDARKAVPPAGIETHYRMPEYKTLGDWEARRAHLRKQILASAGLFPMPERTPLNPQVFGRVERDGYTIEKVLIETLPGFWLGGNLYRPAGKSGVRSPGVLMAHGHWTYGRLENSPEFSGQALGISLARQGYVGFAYDMIGYNDTVQLPHVFGRPAEQLWSFTSLGVQLWNSIRALDFLAALPDVDSERLGVTGASGGGTQTYLLAAVDDRIRVAAPVNMVSAIYQGGCGCENNPGLRAGTFNVEIASTIAPRPLLLVAATGDWTKNVPREEYPAIRKIYDLYGKADNVETFQQQADHNYNQVSREAVYRFFRKHLGGTGEDPAERGIQAEKLQDMLALQNRVLPAGAVDERGLFEVWRKQTPQAADAASKRERLALALGTEWPAAVASQIDGERIALSSGRGDRVTGVWLPGGGSCAAVVAGAERGSKAVANLRAEKCSVLLVEPFQSGLDLSKEHLTTYNRTDDANRVQDLVTALAFVNAKRPAELRLVGAGSAAVSALFAAAVAPVKVKLQADLSGFRGTDDDFVERFFVPGIQRAGGLEAARSLVSTRP